MQIVTIANGPLAVCVVQPGGDRYWNWSANAWEPAPFVAANHARPMTSMTAGEATPSPLRTVLAADIGEILASQPNTAAIVLSVAGSNYTPIDVWTLPVPPYGAPGGFTRF